MVIYLISLTAATTVRAVRLALDVVMAPVVLVEALARDEVLPAAVSPALGMLTANLEVADLKLTHMIALAGVVAAAVTAVATMATTGTSSSEEHVV